MINKLTPKNAVHYPQDKEFSILFLSPNSLGVLEANFKLNKCPK